MKARKPPSSHVWKHGKPSARLRAKKQTRKSPRVIVRGKPLHISISVQTEYTNAIRSLVDKMTSEVTRELIALFKEDFAREHFGNDSVAMDAKNISSQTRILINEFKKRYDLLFNKHALSTAQKMADNVNRSSRDSVKASVSEFPNLKDMGKQLTIKIDQLDKPTLQILKSAADGGASFITSIPERFINTVADQVYKSIAVGNGLQDLIPFLEKQGVTIKNWAHNTAMDQTRKAYNGLNRGRLMKIGITKGEWLHSGGSLHPRELHEDFDGQTFDIIEGAPVGDDGENVMPGEEPNCRCTFGPVIEDNNDTDVTENNDDEE